MGAAMTDRNDILEGLRRSGPILTAFVNSIPAAQMNRRRGDGAWTIAEHTGHLAQVQPMLLERILRFMREDEPEFIPYIPGEDDAEERPPVVEMPAAFEAFNRYRQKQVALLETADDLTWQKVGRHPEYALYSLYILVRHILMHDHWHMYRMEELWLTRDAYLTKLP